MCRKCAELDGEGSCAIDNTPYEIGFDPVIGRITCQYNTTPCARHLCTCDEQLAFDLAANWSALNSAIMLINGFDHAATCLPKPPSGGSCAAHPATEEITTQCCGSYPNRFPFNNKGGCMSCCAGVTFNIYNHDCCGDTIASFGSC